MRTFVAWTLAAAAVAAPSAALARPAASRAADEPPVVSRAANLIGQIDHWRNRTWYWQRVMGQQRYGGWLLRTKGPAHRWTPIEQIWVAERGRRVQGWYAWPHTARACGLI